MKNWVNEFENPSASFRGVPFWAWNAELEPDELRRQIGVMQEMGFGGFFMHSRVGLATPYLSERWFECINACIDEAEKRGMKAWLYDEDRWPSGAAGSLVTRDPKYRQRTLECRNIEDDPAPEQGDVWFRIRTGDQGFLGYDRVSGPEDMGPEQGGALYRFRIRLNDPSSWYNGATYLDTLNPDAVKRFLETTHEAYAAHCGKAFGRTVPGIFTDEPNYGGFYEGCVPWTDALPEKFREKYGYDILDHLPELFFECGKTVSRVRWQYYDLLTDLFVHSFSAQIGEWCRKHGIAMTGHVLSEDSLRSQVKGTGAPMRFYEYMQMPGVDLLTEYWQTFNTMKQCSSVARQMGHDVRLSETYGCTGWDFPFMGHKALGDWQYALGINFRCQHLAWYSMEGEAKRDYPASISFQSSWWNKYHCVEDYFARLGAVMTGGKEIRDILMIHPVESVWSVRKGGAGESGKEELMLDSEWNKLTDRLLTVNCDFDFGDEEMMSRLAKVEDGVFRVGQAEYKAVLIPKILTIRSTTLQLLKKWAEAGGLVVYYGEPPAFVDALPSKEAADVYNRLFVPVDWRWLEEKLLRIGRRLSVTDPYGSEIGPVLSRLAQKDGAWNLFLCNTSMPFNADRSSPMVRDRILAFPKALVRVSIPENGDVYELDPADGSVYEVPYRRENGCYVFRTSFAPLQSRLFVFTPERPEKVSVRSEFHTELDLGPLPGGDEWRYSLSDFNSLVLDHCTLKVGGRTELENTFFIKADDYLREKLLGVAPRGGLMVQPWLQDKTIPEKQLDIELSYDIVCACIPKEDCFLGLERPELYGTILFNDEPVSPEPAGPGWWIDPVLKTLRIPKECFRAGRNRLTLAGRYHEKLPGLESLFLLGRFGVFGDEIGALPGCLKIGNWVEQGLREYSGDVIYERIFEADPAADEHWFLRFGAWRGAALTISVNGGEERTIPWPPFELDLTSGLVKGENRIAIRVCGSRRNAFGPFFAGQKWMEWTGPKQFKKYNSPDRQLVPSGLLEMPGLLIRK